MAATAKTSKADASKTVAKAPSRSGKTGQPVRLYVKGVFLGYQRSIVLQRTHHALIQIDGVKDKKATEFYLGKRVAYIYRAHKQVKGSHYRVIWGRIARPHGNNGVVRAHFRTNLPPRAIGATVRVFLFPSRV